MIGNLIHRCLELHMRRHSELRSPLLTPPAEAKEESESSRKMRDTTRARPAMLLERSCVHLPFRVLSEFASQFCGVRIASLSPLFARTIEFA